MTDTFLILTAIYLAPSMSPKNRERAAILALTLAALGGVLDIHKMYGGLL